MDAQDQKRIDPLKERKDAYRVLLQWQRDGSFIKENGLSPFAMEIALGVCRRYLYLLYVIKHLTKRMPSEEAGTIIAMGLVQMLYMNVPDYAAIATSADLAKAVGLGDGTASLVNGVLRGARRNGMPELPPQRVRKVSIENSVPEWLVRRWFDIYGGDRAEQIARTTLTRPAEWLRVNLQKTSAPKLAQKLGFENASILYDRYVEVPENAKLKAVLESDSFAKGEFSLQNPSAYEVVKLLDLKPGLKVWDACAAPGGKSALMAEMDGSLDILASDVSETRMAKMQDLAKRLGLTNIRTACIDILSENLSSLVSRAKPVLSSVNFDRILLDVPCSNMGVLARRPEVVYRLSPASFKELSELQYSILEAAATHLAVGGRLVYATCSPDPLETTQVVNRFVKAHPEFAKVGDPVLPANKDSRFDGFFAQALVKNS